MYWRSVEKSASASELELQVTISGSATMETKVACVAVEIRAGEITTTAILASKGIRRKNSCWDLRGVVRMDIDGLSMRTVRYAKIAEA